SRRQPAPGRRNAAGDGCRRNPAAQRPARAEQRSLLDGASAVARGDAAGVARGDESQSDRRPVRRRPCVLAGILQPDQPHGKDATGGGMSTVRARIQRGPGARGGIVGYPLNALYREVAFVAYHFHWQPEAVLGLEHAERRRWVEEISSINERMNEE